MKAASLDQLRAGRAYARVTRASGQELALAQDLPTMLQRNGLVATWAFCLAKGKQEHRFAVDSMLEHLRDERFGFGIGAGDRLEVFHGWVGAEGDGPIDSVALRRLTAEALAFSGWLKRAAEARPDSSAETPEQGGAA